MLGDALVILCSLFWALHIIFAGKFMKKFDLPIFYASLQSIFVFSLSIIAAYVFEEIDIQKILLEYSSILYAGILSGGVAFTLQMYAQKNIEEAMGAQFGAAGQIFQTLKDIVTAGKNVLVGDNVKIGKNCLIGHNSIIERNVQIGDNCKIGSNTILRNSVIKDNVTILDNCVIGKKGFGFFPSQSKNLRYPHIGIVIINENSEIGCGSTIDRGSLSNTEIGKNTFLDNQIHIAHNVKIGENCVIAGQVGFAGSSTLGNHVMIGGQAGVSGHLKIGNNVQIGGGSGVIKDIPDNSKVMGYPAKSLKNFISENK